MKPCKVEFRNEADCKCTVHGSIVRTVDYVYIYSFECCPPYRVHKDKIIEITQIELNDGECK